MTYKYSKQMSQSMNGLSLFSGNGISESDNIACNNLSANLINSNAILTDNLNATQTTGALATYSGLVTANKLTAGNVHADTRIDCDLFECRRLNSYDVIEGNQITCNRLNVLINGDFAAISSNNIKNVRQNCGLAQNTNSVENVLLGTNCGSTITNNSSYNIGIGSGVFDLLNSNSSYNICLGYGSGKNIKGNHNICIGWSTGQLLNATNDIYNDSVAIGNNSKITASNQIVLGTANETVLIRGAVVVDDVLKCKTLVLSDVTGNEVLDSIIVSNLFGLTSNVQKFINRISRDSLGSLTTGFNNLALGQFALAQLTTGSYNIAVGQDSLYDLVSGSNNIAVGKNSGSNNIDGINNICLGTNTRQATDASGISYRNSVAIGANATYDASNQIVLGTVDETVIVKGAFVCDSSISTQSLELSNLAFTPAILTNILNLTSNVQDQFDKLSKDSGLNVTTGVRNIALGEFTLATNTTGSYNIGIGEQCLNDVVTGNNNIAIGKYAGGSLISSSDCICIGTETDQGSVGTFFNSIAVGYRAKFNASNQIILGDSTHTLKIAGKVECDDIITKSKMKYGRVQGNTSNSITVVVFDEPFPETGPMPYVQLTPIYTSIYNTSPGFLFLIAFSHNSFAFEFIYNGVSSSASIQVNWMAMVP